jgi:hypothetical protein
MPIIWKKVFIINDGIRGTANHNFKFYRLITNANNIYGRYIQKLVLRRIEFWPICIEKILRACPNIQELELSCYYPNDHLSEKITAPKLLNCIKSLPNLKKLDMFNSYDYFGNEAILNLIDSKPKFAIINTTKKCEHNEDFIMYDEYNGKEWVCHSF